MPSAYLADSFQLGPPREVLEELRNSPVSLTERAARRSATRSLTVPGQLAMQWERYRRMGRLDPTGPRPSTFLAHLRTTWGFDTYRGFSAHALRRALGSRPPA